MIDAILAKLGNRPGLTLRGNEIVEWPYEVPIPDLATLEQWQAEWMAANDYKFKRQKDMPSKDDLLEALYDDIDKNKLDKTGEFYKKIKAVNDKHPKPA